MSFLLLYSRAQIVVHAFDRIGLSALQVVRIEKATVDEQWSIMTKTEVTV